MAVILQMILYVQMPSQVVVRQDPAAARISRIVVPTPDLLLLLCNTRDTPVSSVTTRSGHLQSEQLALASITDGKVHSSVDKHGVTNMSNILAPHLLYNPQDAVLLSSSDNENGTTQMPKIDVTTSHLLSNISLVTDGTALLQNIDTAPVHMFLPKNGATPSAVNGTTQWIIQANTLRDHHLCQLLNI